AERVEDPALQLLAKCRARHMLDQQPQRRIAGARVRPALAGREEPGLLQGDREHLAWAELEPARRVLAVRLEELDQVVEEVGNSARGVQELPDRDAAHDRLGAAV